MKMPIENIQPLLRCPVCNKKYKPAKILVLDETDKCTTLHMTCGNCSSSSMIFVSMGQFGIISLGMLTDLEQGEAQKVFKREAISSDQVIEVHQFLKQYNGGVEALL